MTFRAVLIGVIGAVLLATVGYWADKIAHLNRFVSGQFSIVIYGPLVLFVLVIGPLVGRLRRSWRLKGAELAVIIAAMLAACCIPSNGLLRYFTRCLVMPIHMNRSQPSWQRDHLLADAPRVLLANGGEYDEELVVGFIAGKGTRDDPIPPGLVPWGPWAQTLTFWGAAIFLFGLASVCLALIVHPQWTRRERLRYPIAEFANTMLASGEPGQAGARPPIHRRRMFWIALAGLLLIHVVNGLHLWWPDRTIAIPLSFDFSAVGRKFPKLLTGWGAWRIQNPVIWPTAVALAFFLAKDVTFSVGISQPLATLLLAGLLHAGILQGGGSFVVGKPDHYQRAGSCLALAVMLLYLGRHYYWGLLKRAVGLRGGGEIEGYAVAACRILFLALAALVGLLIVALHLPWPLAVAFVGLTMLAFLSVSRITAEFGMFYVQIIWFPSAVLVGLLGAWAMGPGAFVAVAMLSTVFVAQPEECLLPFVIHGLKIADCQKVSVGRTGTVAGAAFVLAAAVAIPFALWVDYSYGGIPPQQWDSYGQPKQPFDELQKAKTNMRLAGELESSRELTDWQRVTQGRPRPMFLWSAGLGFAAVILTYVLRLRWHWWPIHPILFLIWETWASAQFFHSFLLAWLIQLGVSKLGTRKAYDSAKDFMIGVIAGEMLGGMLWMTVGAIYYETTGLYAPYYNIFPY